MLQRSSERMEMVVDIYESVDAVRGHNPYLHSTDTKRDPDTAPHTGGATAWGRCYRVTIVCVVLLCFPLMTAVTLLWIKFNILKTEANLLQTSNNNLTKERNQLQTSYNNLTKERNQLQTSYNNLTIEKDRLQRERDGYLKIFRDSYKGKYFIFSSSLYFMYNEQKNWTESRQDCRDKGADLVIINSKEEQEFISKQVNGKINVWIGLSDRDREREWKWVDGTTLTTERDTTFWASGEPNGGDGENCVEFYSGANENSWNDNNCSRKLHWMCEFFLQ